MQLDVWDYLTFLAFIVCIFAYARKHSQAEAVNVMGWLGFLAVVPWMQAFLWAFKPTDVILLRDGYHAGDGYEDRPRRITVHGSLR